ncbi:MAG TPA: MBL fold metallo-hydrolase [Chthoniobacterales bacterium]
MLDIQTFIGGIFDTNAYLVEAPQGDLLVDAPTGTCEWLSSQNRRPRLLLITHGHVDHIDDAARIAREFQCPVACHRESVPLLTDPDVFRKLGFNLEVESVQPSVLIEETAQTTALGLPLQVLLVPGHCPGSLCFYHRESANLFSGDTLFAGSIGRTDLPGGDLPLLLRGLHSKVLVLPDATRVLPGHGPATTVGVERRTNPYLAR